MTIKFTYYKPHILIPVIGFLWSISSLGFSKLWGYGFLQGTGPTAVVMLFLFFYDKWLWKYPVMNLMAEAPNLNGVYEGEISFHWDGQNKTKACKLVIKQTLSVIKISCFFNKVDENDTRSVSTEAFIKTDDVGDRYLYFCYHNHGSCKDGDSLNPHDGMNVLEIDQSKETISLEGYYFTNRNPQTKGCMKVTKTPKGDK